MDDVVEFAGRKGHGQLHMPKKTPSAKEDKPAKASAADFLPADERSLETLRLAASECRGCDLYKDATQTVFGEGPVGARVMFVGEQPGDQEDKSGHPFVGPAGKLLRKAMEAAGISEEDVYMTNAVKHFKYEWRGKRRLHAKPRRLEVVACMPWLDSEISALRPAVIVCLGATAAQALLGTQFRLTQHRGEWLPRPELARYVMATIHPSSILRAPDDETRHQAMNSFVSDLKKISELSDL